MLSLVPPGQPKERQRCVRVGDEGSVGWKGTADHTVSALLPRPDFTLLLYRTAGAILLLLLGRACTFPIPSAGPCGVGDSVLTPGTSSPQPSAHPLLQCWPGPPVAIVECHTVLIGLGRSPAHETSPGLSPGAAAIARDPGDPAPPALPCRHISPSDVPLPWKLGAGSRTTRAALLKCVRAYSPVKAYSYFPQKMALGFTKSEPLSILNIFTSVKNATRALHCGADGLPPITEGWPLQSVQPPPPQGRS